MLVIFPDDTCLGELVSRYAWILYRHEFEPGKFNVAKMDEAMQTARLGFTYFKGNAAPIPRQLNKYSEFCKDIAVFDWSGIVLFDLNSWDLITKHAGYGCFYTGQDNGGIFSLALLGFIIQALGRHLYGGLLFFSLVSSNCANTLSRSFSCHSAFSSQYVNEPSSQREIRR